MRQDPQPLIQQRPDVLLAQGITDRLQRRHVIDGGEGVVQRGEADPGPGGLPLGPLVAVEAQLGVEREVAAELEEERAEAVIDAVAVELVDHTGLQRDPRVGRAVVAAALAGPEQRDLLLRPADEQHAIGPGEPGQELLGHVVLALAPGEVDPGDLPLGGEGPHRPGERLGHRCQRRSGRHRHAQLPVDIADQPGRVLQLRDVDVQVHPVNALHLEGHMARQHISS